MHEHEHILIAGFEREMLRMADRDERDPRVRAELDEQLRLAVLFSSGAALVPAAGYFETEVLFDGIRAFAPSVERGQLALLGGGGRPADYMERKQAHWAGDGAQLELYGRTAERRIEALDGRGWRVKRSSTDAGLLERWAGAVGDGSHPLLEVWVRAGVSAADAEQALAEFPAGLEGEAMVVDVIVRRLPANVRAALVALDRHRLRVFLAEGFFGSYLADAGAVALTDGRSGATNAVMPDGTDLLEVRRLKIALQGVRLDGLVLRGIGHAELAVLADSAVWESLRAEILRRVGEEPMFTARELRKLADVREPRGLGVPGRIEQLELYVQSLAHALATAERRYVPGRSRGPSSGQESLFPTGGRPMGGMQFNGPTSIQGPVVNVDGGGDANVTSTPVSVVTLVPELRRVLGAPNAADAEGLLRAMEAMHVGRLPADSHAVADVVTRELQGDVAKMRPSVRQGLINLGTGASAGVLAQGVMLGLKALVGG